ncbi:MAG TPA: DUF2461 domain-containing protein [Azospirillaceae bacterium]|nr:DUF2461 domain-containing protein [Azospirillaceae bacterium]
MTGVPGFDGFREDGLAFLRALAANNDRAWFAAHKTWYTDGLLDPMRRLVVALAPVMVGIDPALEVDPRRGTISRLHRDTRFSADKAPFRVNQWIAFKPAARDWTDRPAFFLEFDADRHRYGMGFYRASPATMAAVREAIQADPPAFAAAVAAAAGAGFELAGEVYRRPRPFTDLPDAARGWFCRKNAYMVRAGAVDAVFLGPELVERIAGAFTAAAPLYRFLNDRVCAYRRMSSRSMA